MKTAVDQYCRRDLEDFERRLRDLKSGRFKVGTSSDGRTWTDTTAEDIKSTEARIAELKRLLRSDA